MLILKLQILQFSRSAGNVIQQINKCVALHPRRTLILGNQKSKCPKS